MSKHDYIPFITPSNNRRNLIIHETMYIQLPIRLIAQFGSQKKRKTASISKNIKLINNILNANYCI